MRVSAILFIVSPGKFIMDTTNIQLDESGIRRLPMECISLKDVIWLHRGNKMEFPADADRQSVQPGLNFPFHEKMRRKAVS